MANKFLQFVAASFALMLGLSAFSYSQTSPRKDFPNIKISNFGQMDERFYRGAQPKKKDYQTLKNIGIQTVIDLQEKPKSYEKDLVETLGMKYVNIPIPDKAYPSDEHVAEFLKTVNDPETGVFYVHCAGGRHRTGDMGAVYRFTRYGWDFDRVYEEMKNYDFYTGRGHGKQRDFVIDYAAKIGAEKLTAVE